jgi:methionyl-tRNA formyltransferase
MKLFVVTQDENVYLPKGIAAVCRAFPGDVTCIVSAPAMSTHGGKVPGFLRHVRLFGIGGSAKLGVRVIAAKLRALRGGKPGPDGPFNSMSQVAQAFGVPHVHVDRLKSDEFAAAVEKYGGDLLISMSCPQIIGKAIRDKFPMGAINLHSSPLPRYRGLMPAFWVLRNGEKETAITVHELAAKLDDGDILAQQPITINADETWDSLVRKTKEAGSSLLIETIRKIADGTAVRRPNPESEATYFSFPTAADKRAFAAAGRKFF